MTKLMGLDFKIQYKPRLENRRADALSHQMMFAAVSIVRSWLWSNLECEAAQDLELQQIIVSLQLNPDVFPGYFYVDKKLFYDRKLVIPSSSVDIPAHARIP